MEVKKDYRGMKQLRWGCKNDEIVCGVIVLGVNYLVGNCLGDNCPGRTCLGGNFLEVIVLGAIVRGQLSWGNCARILLNISVFTYSDLKDIEKRPNFWLIMDRMGHILVKLGLKTKMQI